MKNNNPDFETIEVLKRTKSYGFQSHVLKHAEISDEPVLLGHACFFDFEDSNYHDAVREITKKHNTRAIFVFESSDGNYHAVSPRIMSLQEINDLKSNLEHDDDAHREIGYKKGCWTLRLSEKGNKPKPKFVKAYLDLHDYDKEYAYSRPHMEILKQSYDNKAIDMCFKLIEKSENFVGAETRLVQYSTHENNH